MGHYNSEYQWTITLIWTDLLLTTTELHPLKCRHIFIFEQQPCFLLSKINFYYIKLSNYNDGHV